MKGLYELPLELFKHGVPPEKGAEDSRFNDKSNKYSGSIIMSTSPLESSKTSSGNSSNGN